MAPKVDIIVPVLNEEDSVDEFYARIDELGLTDSLIFVDNASSDNTVAKIENYPNVRLLRHQVNEGWGASLRNGIDATDGDLILLIDADLEYPPEAIPTLLDALRRNPVVYASRFCDSRPPEMPFARRVGNTLISRLYNVLYNQHTTDFATGMKGIRRSALPLERLQKDDWVHAAEIAALIAFSGHQIEEIGIEYRPRQHGRSKMKHLTVAAKLIGYLVLYRIRGTITS